MALVLAFALQAAVVPPSPPALPHIMMEISGGVTSHGVLGTYGVAYTSSLDDDVIADRIRTNVHSLINANSGTTVPLRNVVVSVTQPEHVLSPTPPYPPSQPSIGR